VKRYNPLVLQLTRTSMKGTLFRVLSRRRSWWRATATERSGIIADRAKTHRGCRAAKL